MGDSCDNDRVLKWGILGTGRISNDFVCCLKKSNNHEIVGCAARTADKAKQFSESHGLVKHFESYEHLIGDEEVQVVYIGSINSAHFNLIKLALEGGKHVLCEKPLCTSHRDTELVIRMAKKKNLFLMEGIWSRCFPVYDRVKEEIKAGKIGEVCQVIASFGSFINQKERVRMKELGGGIMLDVGIYCVQLATMIFGEKAPLHIMAGGHLNQEGVDESITACLVYPEGKMASIVLHGLCRLENNALIIGTKGILKLPKPFWCPTELILADGSKESFTLPDQPENYNFLNSAGLIYEADHVRECILKNLTESPLIPLNESLTISVIMEMIRRQLGVEC